jgi:hypothetical protein
VLIVARTLGSEAACRSCGVSATRIHSRYRRCLHDLSSDNRPVAIELEARRFFCGNPDCAAVTFAEQIPGITQWHAHRTPGLRGLLEAIALALAGRAGARLAGVLGIEISRSTLIRAAVINGLTLPHSSGAVEGNVCRARVNTSNGRCSDAPTSTYSEKGSC